MGSKISEEEKKEGLSPALWRSELKLQALAHLFGHEDSDEEVARAYGGISIILEEIIERLIWVRESIDKSGKKAGPR